MLQLGALTAEQMGVVVALGAGMLIGLERERRKGDGPKRESAGLRTFMVAALLGVCAQIISGVLAAVALAGVIVLAALSYLRSRSDDPGLTTELALVATALIGMLAVPRPELAAAAAVLLASLLAARERLHHFATHWLSEEELHDGLLLAALALVLMPLLPSQPIEWLGHLSPQRVLMLVIVILSMQAAGHVAQRLLGARLGVIVSGVLGGFVSSTATISAFGARSRNRGMRMRIALCGGVVSSSATWLQALLIGALVSPAHVLELLPSLLSGACLPLFMGFLLWQSPREQESREHVVQGRVLCLREAGTVSALLVVGAMAVQLANQFGGSSLFVGVAIAAIADAHAPIAALWSIRDSGQLTTVLLLKGVLVAISVNSITRTAVAALSGGWRYAAGIGTVLCLSLLAGAAWLTSVSGPPA